MSFDVAAEAYDQFMGRFSQPLAAPFLALAGLAPGDRAVDVGCGPGALTEPLVSLLGADRVSAVDPSAPFVAAVETRLPGVDVRRGSAEDLPFDDDSFDAALASLVVHFMTDPVAGLREMARVTRPGGRVLASVWDHAGGAGPLSTFWQGVRDLEPGAHDESGLSGTLEGQLVDLGERAGLTDVEPHTVTVRVGFETFEEWWQPYERGVGPAGAYVGRLDRGSRERLVDHLRGLLPDPPFELSATAWCIRARAPR